ncbi:MAG: phage tail length tape measure family protein [Phycisphaerae bacterium]|nr:phage tail length tape measure family protein [Phycisphaerae bacterium]
MATRALDIVVRGKDRASGVFSRIGGAARGMGRALFSVKGLMLSALGGYGLKAAVSHATELWEEQAKAEGKLAGVLKATGGAAGFTAGQLKQMASNLQEVTTYGDEAILNAQAILATFTQIKGDTFKQATEAILDMSAVLDQDLKGSAIQLGKALNDPIKGVTALRKVGVSFTTQQMETIKALTQSGQLEQAQAVILTELQHEFGGVAKGMAATSGAGAQLKNAIGDVWEAFGKSLSPAIREFRGLIKSLLPNLTNLAGGLGENVLTAVQLARFAFGNWEKIVNFTVDSARLKFMSLWEDFKYAFTTTLPTYIGWFARNWKELLIDAANAISYGIENMAANICMVMKEVWTYISSWGQEGFAEGWSNNLRGIMDGFKSVVTEEFPEVADRASTALEMALASSIDAQKGRLTELMVKSLSTATPTNRLEIPVKVSQDAATQDFVKAVKSQNQAYVSRFMRYAPGQILERGYSVKVAPDPKTREIADGVKRTNVLLSRLITATEAPTEIDMEVYEP